MKEKFELEILLKTSLRVLDNMIGSPSGLSEWFADNVTVRDDMYSFEWDGAIEEARLLTRKMNSKMKFRWIEDEENGDDYYFEMNFQIDPMTGIVSLKIVDFSTPDDIESAKMLWEQQINDLRRIIGA
ncbi:MAG: START-like domain-containing protein [Crocinitomicaceae bacterium]|tara:strand:- start:2603 stop:2986 length:384 start_codon:yes stop_codon:yes gene_type:complete